MRINFETRLKIFFVLIIVGIIGIAGFTYHYYQSASEINQALARTNQVNSLSQALIIAIQDLEISTDGYSLSTDSNYTHQYQLAKTRVKSHLSQLKTLTQSNMELQRRLHTLSLLIDQKIEQADKLIAIAKTEGITGASDFFKNSHPNDLMQHLKFTLTAINSKEVHTLSKQQREYELQLLNLRYTYYTLLISLIAAVGFIGYFTVYQTRLRKIREWKLQARERQLDEKVRESLKELEKQYSALREIAEIQSHQVRAPIATILGLVDLFNFENPADPNNIDILVKLRAATEAFDEVIEQIVKMTNEIEGLQSTNVDHLPGPRS